MEGFYTKVRQFKKEFGNYLREVFSNVIPDIIFLLGLVSTAATFSPAVAQYKYIGELGWLLVVIGFVWANFSVYRKHAIPQFSTEVMDKLECGYLGAPASKDLHPFIRILVQVVNNSNKNCSIVKIRICADYEWEIDLIADASVVTNEGKIALPYSIPAHSASLLSIQAILRVVAFSSKDIHFNSSPYAEPCTDVRVRKVVKAEWSAAK